ncbi:MAG: hypothetical protein WC195_05450, partial [Bacteroidales bacterium]
AYTYPPDTLLWGSSYLFSPKTCHQEHFAPVFVPGGAQNMPTRCTFAGFSYLVLLAVSAKIL